MEKYKKSSQIRKKAVLYMEKGGLLGAKTAELESRKP
jgi:hypothetical protein